MTALEIVRILHPYQEYLIQLKEAEILRQPQYEWDYSVSLSYTFITLKLLRGTDENTSKDLYLQIIFRIENDHIYLSEIYRADGINTLQLLEEIKANEKLHAKPLNIPKEKMILFLDEIITSLAAADRISQHGVNMYSGDSYWPGNYSKIKITSEVITLEQVNHMNSRSLDHKEDYSLRDLVFQIPLQNTITLKKSFDAVFAGKMLISFSDRSSQNNREAGNKIQEQIKNEL